MRWWDPSKGENPRIDTYEVDMDNCPSKVLDILNKIKNELDPTIAYRRSCAHGVCGSCAMNMGGKNGLACTTPHADIDGDIDIYPLPHLKVKRDLIGDLDGLYRQYQSIEPWLKSNTKSETTEIIQSKEDRKKLDGAYNIQFKKSFSLEKVKQALDNFEGCKVIDERVDGGYITPLEAEGKDETFISRIREDKTIENGLNLWVVSDNLLRGAALNAVEIAETLIKNNFYGK